MSRSNPLNNVRERHAALLEMPAPVIISEWAEGKRILSREANDKGGKFKNLPWQIEPADSLLHPDVQGAVMQWASQLTGKTELINNVTGYFIEHRPRPILNIQYSLDMAHIWSKDRLGPMVRDTPCLRGLVRESRSRIDGEGSTILHKTFPGGRLAVVGSNSAAGLASRPIGLLEGDEIDRWEASAGKEGDPWSLAKKRLESFPDSVWILASTPTIKGISRIEKEMELSDWRKWHVPCPHCDGQFVIEWKNVRWPNPHNARHPAAEHQPENAYIECPWCKAELSDEQRIDMVRNGQWLPTKPFKGRRGYQLNGLVTLFKALKGYKNRLHQSVTEFLDAKKLGPEALKVWTNTFLAETWEDLSERPTAPEVLYARRENYPTLPDRCVMLACGADVQADRIEAEIFGIGEGEETWGVEYRQFRGNVEQWAVWDEFDQWIQTRFPHVSGHELQPAIVMIDSGHKPKMVQAFCRRCSPRRVEALKGVGQGGLPWVTRSKNQRLALVKVNSAKDAIYSRAKLIDHGPGYMHFPESYPLEWFQQLMSERRVTRYKSGLPESHYELQPGARNEALDARVYGMAGIEILRPNYRKLAQRLTPIAPVETPETPEPEQPEPDQLTVNQVLTPKPQVSPPKRQISQPFRRQMKGWMRM